MADWSEWKQGERAEGIVTSLSSFGSKLGTGLGAALVGIFLSLSSYDGTSAASSAVQQAEITVMMIVPMVVAILQIVLLVFWNMDKIHPQIMAELDKQRK